MLLLYVSMVREGFRLAALPLAFGIAALAAGWIWPGELLFLPWVGLFFLLLAAFVLYFFRDPERSVPADPLAVVSPADGRVMEVVSEVRGPKPGRRISIFLSVWDVHVNRIPYGGTIRRIEHRPGQFLAAMRSRASAENEQNVIQLATERGEVVFKQIAGWIARRILCWKSEGDRVATGERFGMIRFGSRMDVWLPIEAKILVRPGEHVRAGSSILARWK